MGCSMRPKNFDLVRKHGSLTCSSAKDAMSAPIVVACQPCPSQDADKVDQIDQSLVETLSTPYRPTVDRVAMKLV